MDDSFKERITPRLVAERMMALAEHYQRVITEARLAQSHTWLGEFADELRYVADLLRREERDGYRSAMACLAVLRRRAHDYGGPFLMTTLDNYCMVVGWLYDAATR